MSDLPEERWLEDQLWKNEAEPLFKVLRVANIHATSAWRQLTITNAGTTDFLALVQDRDVLVVELKRTADEGAIAQCLRYVGALDLALESEEREVLVYGAIIAFDFTPGAIMASRSSNVKLIQVGLGDAAHMIEASHLAKFPEVPPNLKAALDEYKPELATL